MNTTTDKTCTRCGVTQPLDEFSPHRDRTDGRVSWCKTCHREYRRHKYATDADQRAQEQVRNRAYFTALQALKLRHPHEFDELYDQAKRAEGLGS